MAYGQKNYNEMQGIPPQKYRINQIGCFLVSFCNLLERFGKNVDPLTLNRIFRERGIWIDVDDGVRDDLGWQSVTGYDGHVVVNATGRGRPPHNNCIVKFVGVGSFGTHFCLVADVNQGLIIDSWDGQVKSWNVYGGPVEWAAYGNTTPQPVPPPPAPPAQAPSRFEPIEPRALQVTKNPTALWNLDAQKWPDFKAVDNWAPGRTFTAVAIYHHPLGGNYYVMTNGEMRGFNTVDTAAAPPPAPVPTPAPEPAPAPPVTEPSNPVPTEPSPAPETPEAPAPVTPVDWKATFKEERAGRYVANKDVPIKDLAGLQVDLQLRGGQKVDVAGVFEKDGTVYYRTAKSVQSDFWYGLPTDCLTLIELEDDMFNLDVVDEAKELLKNLTGREKLVALIARIQGFFLSIGTFLTKRSKNK